MRTKKEYKDITETVGYFEGYPIQRTCTADEQKDAEENGFPLKDFLDWFFTPQQDWQCDC